MQAYLFDNQSKSSILVDTVRQISGIIPIEENMKMRSGSKIMQISLEDSYGSD